MTLRRMIWSVAATAALGGASSAAPPALSEGRELDPVGRDFFLAGPTAPAPGGEAAPTSAAPAVSFLGSVREAILAKLTVPLGTVRPASRHR